MKKLLFTFGLMLVASMSFAQSSVYVDGYTKSNGTYVQGYYKSTPNTTATNNYSYSGNVNPYTYSTGNQNLYQNTTPRETRTLYSGSQGGTYYYNSNNNKTYVRTK